MAIETLRTLNEFIPNSCKAGMHIFNNHRHINIGTREEPEDLDCVDCGCAYEAIAIFKNELKQEAIKWIKFLALAENNKEYIEGYFDNQLDDMANKDGTFNEVINAIAWIFNIVNKKKDSSRWFYNENIEDMG